MSGAWREDGPDARERDIVSLLAALRRLDGRLQRAAAAARAALGSEEAGDAYRGLYIARDDVARLLAREPGAPALACAGPEESNGLPRDVARPSTRLGRLAATFELSVFDLDLVLIALAPEVDLRYERLYAFLQDDVTRRRPGVDLALDLLCDSAGEKLARHGHFGPGSPLIRHALIHLFADPDRPHAPLLGQAFRLDEPVADWLLGRGGPDRRLASFCEIIEPGRGLDDLPPDPVARRALTSLVRAAGRSRTPLRLYLHGPAGRSRRRTAEALAGVARVPLLTADLARAPSADADLGRALVWIFREARIRDVAVLLDGLDVLRDDEQPSALLRLRDALGEAPGLVIMAGARPWDPGEGGPGRGPIGALVVPLPAPDFAGRRACWAAELQGSGSAADPADIDALADRFRLTPDRIAEAVAAASHSARWRVAADPRPGTTPEGPTRDDLFAAARAHSGRDLSPSARKVVPAASWEDLVLPEDALAQLREIRGRVAHRHRVLGTWGFGDRLSQGKGVNALFVGPSGTGKTMAAEVLARELGLDLYKIELSVVVSKWIGETEKNLDRIFQAADHHMLFFDEADALFGKRSEVRDSHDRYANLEISYLLQRMEEYEGVAILATNLRGNMDEAFTRRLAFTVHFALPDAASRLRIWEGIWPAGFPLDGDADLGELADRFPLSGGHIKNIALAAAFLAAEAGTSVGMGHLLHATQREYQKMGKSLSEAELLGTAMGSAR